MAKAIIVSQVIIWLCLLNISRRPNHVLQPTRSAGASRAAEHDRWCELMRDPDPEKSKRVTDAMLKMQKIIVADLQKAYDG